jgi:hypothetical protein
MRCFEYPLVIELNKLIKRNIVMDFNLTEEQLMIQQAARDFAQSELLPG